MDKYERIFELFQIASILNPETLDYEFLANKFAFDMKVNDALIKMYVFLMTSDDSDLLEDRYEQFNVSYERLNKEQQEYMQAEFLKMLDYKEKVKKKIKNERKR